MPGYIKGILVALANTVVIALAIAVSIERNHVLEAVFAISFMGFFPALIVGGLLGRYGEDMQTTDRRVVCVGMCAVACGAVAVLGLMFAMLEVAVVSFIPTVAGCAILERWTRAAPELPLARVA